MAEDKTRQPPNLKVVGGVKRGSPPPPPPGGPIRRKTPDLITQCDRDTVRVIRALKRGVAKNAPIEPPRANAIIFALRFRTELYDKYKAGESLRNARREIAELNARVEQMLSSGGGGG